MAPRNAPEGKPSKGVDAGHQQLSRIVGQSEPGASPSTQGDCAGFPCNCEGSLRDILDEIGILEQMAGVCPLLGVDLDAPARTEPTSPSQTPGARVVIANSGKMVFKGSPPTLRTFIGSDDDPPGGADPEHLLDAQVAVENAQNLVFTLGMSDDLSGAVPAFDCMGKSPQGNLYGAQWVFIIARRFQGYRTPSFYQIAVSASSGRVRAFSDSPLVVPETMDVKLTAEDACEIVSKFLKEHRIPPGGKPDTRLEIVIPNSAWAEGSQASKPPDVVHQRLAYVVQLQPEADPKLRDESWLPYFFYVDAATGGIIGGPLNFWHPANSMSQGT